MRALVVMLLAGLCLPGCGASHRTAPQRRPPVPGAPARVEYGTITGRYYADGGPRPLGDEPARPIIGTITVTDVRSRRVYRPSQDAGGSFRLVVPVGSYEVTARSPGIADPLTRSVTVAARETVEVELAVHMI